MKINIQQLKRFLEYIFAFIAILQCNSIYACAKSSSLLPFLGVVILMIIIFTNTIQNNKKISIISLLFFIAYFLLTFIIFLNAYNKISFIFRFGLIFPIILLYFLSNQPKEDNIKLFFKLSNIIYYLSIISLILWGLVSVLKLLPLNMVTTINWGETKPVRGYFGIYYETQKLLNFVRNSGIFAEAPMYNFVLCYALLIEMFLRKKIKVKRIIILSLTILSTLTTSGLLTLLLLVGCKLLFIKTSNIFLKILKLSIIPITITIVVLAAKMIITEKQNSNSFKVRTEKIQQGIENWLEHPILGMGYGKSTEGNSNSIFVILSDGGLVIASFYLFALLFIPILHSFRHNNRNYILFAAILFPVFALTIIMYTLLIFLIIAFWYSTIINSKEIDYLNE